jgi:hypothetical protein
MAPKKKLPETDYSEVAKNVLKAELRRRGISYADLAALLTKAGSPENDKNLNNKIARGGFSAAFLMQCLDVIGAKAIQIAD